ncbi:unnamed protein product, partial [Symbiodinium sp. CCMP2592]
RAARDTSPFARGVQADFDCQGHRAQGARADFDWQGRGARGDYDWEGHWFQSARGDYDWEGRWVRDGEGSTGTGKSQVARAVASDFLGPDPGTGGYCYDGVFVPSEPEGTTNKLRPASSDKPASARVVEKELVFPEDSFFRWVPNPKLAIQGSASTASSWLGGPQAAAAEEDAAGPGTQAGGSSGSGEGVRGGASSGSGEGVPGGASSGSGEGVRGGGTAWLQESTPSQAQGRSIRKLVWGLLELVPPEVNVEAPHSRLISERREQIPSRAPEDLDDSSRRHRRPVDRHRQWPSRSGCSTRSPPPDPDRRPSPSPPPDLDRRPSRRSPSRHLPHLYDKDEGPIQKPPEEVASPAREPEHPPEAAEHLVERTAEEEERAIRATHRQRLAARAQAEEKAKAVAKAREMRAARARTKGKGKSKAAGKEEGSED